MQSVEIANLNRIEIPSIDENLAKAFNLDQKGWSFSYVFHFTEIRDIFLAAKLHSSADHKKFTKYCLQINLPFVKTPWNARRVLEHLNALKNFGFLNSKYEVVKEDVFTSKIGESITSLDAKIFKEVFFKYFRFREIMSWFIDITNQEKDKFIQLITEETVLSGSKPLFYFSDKSRFTDSFFYNIHQLDEVYFINHERNEDLMRFWDVFAKWALSLDLIEKFNLKSLGYKLDSGSGVSGMYFINPECQISEDDILKFIPISFNSNYIYIPELVLRLCLKYRAKVENIKNLVINVYVKNKDKFSLERTSEVFIKSKEFRDNEIIFFPKYKDSFVSHLIVRK